MSKKIFIRHRQMKSETLLEILKAAAEGASCKREVESRTGLSWGKVSATVNLLLEKEIIEFSEDTAGKPAGAGRRSSRFRFSRKNFLGMGIELQRRRIVTMLIAMDGSGIGRRVLPLDSGLNAENLSENVHAAFEEQIRQCGIPEGNVIALSFSLTGAVDGFRNVWMQSSHIPSIRNYDFNAVAVEFPHLLHFSIEHDIQARARSVLIRKRWDDGNFVFMHIGGGVGMAVRDRTGFLYGSRGLAGEIGHIPVMNPPPGAPPRRCACGQDNCLETFLSDHGLLTFAREKFGIEAEDLPALFAAATGEQMEEFYGYLHPYLLQAGITASNLFDPETLILGGELLEPWLPRIEAELLPELRHADWMGSPARLRCYSMDSCDSAFGAAANSTEPVLSRISGELVD